MYVNMPYIDSYGNYTELPKKTHPFQYTTYPWKSKSADQPNQKCKCNHAL